MGGKILPALCPPLDLINYETSLRPSLPRKDRINKQQKPDPMVSRQSRQPPDLIDYKTATRPHQLLGSDPTSSITRPDLH
jgi:hypothetical protein